jgi:hypothetical protein
MKKPNPGDDHNSSSEPTAGLKTLIFSEPVPTKEAIEQYCGQFEALDALKEEFKDFVSRCPQYLEEGAKPQVILAIFDCIVVKFTTSCVLPLFIFETICTIWVNPEGKAPNFLMIKEAITLLIKNLTKGYLPFKVGSSLAGKQRTPLNLLLYTVLESKTLKRDEVFEIARLLLEHAPTVRDVQNNQGQTPLHFFCQLWAEDAREGTLQTVLDQLQFLVKDGKANLANFQGATPIQFLTQFWLNKGVSLPAIHAAWKILVDNGHDINAKEGTGHVARIVISRVETGKLKAAEVLETLKTIRELKGVFTDVPLKQGTYLHKIAQDWVGARKVPFVEAFPVIEFPLDQNVNISHLDYLLNTIVNLICTCWLEFEGQPLVQMEDILKTLTAIFSKFSDKDKLKELLALENKSRDTALLTAVKSIFRLQRIQFADFRSFLTIFLENGADVKAETVEGKTVVNLFFTSRHLDPFPACNTWDFVWLMKKHGYKFHSDRSRVYRQKIQRAFIAANLEMAGAFFDANLDKAVPEFQEAWNFIYGLSKENLLEVEYRGLTLWHIGARRLNQDQFLAFLKECSDDLINRVFVKPSLFLVKMDALRVRELCLRVIALPQSIKNDLFYAVARHKYACNKIFILANEGQKLNALERASVYQYEENFEEAVKECCDYLQTCGAELKAQSQGVSFLLAMKEPICTLRIQSDRIVATLVQLKQDREFNRSLIAKLLKEFGLTWLFCYEYQSSIFYNGGSHKLSITRALIYLRLVNEKAQFFETLKNRSQKNTPENKEWLDHLNEVLKAIKDPNNKAFPDFLRGQNILMDRVTEFEDFKLSAKNNELSPSEEPSEQQFERQGPPN